MYDPEDIIKNWPTSIDLSKEKKEFHTDEFINVPNPIKSK